MLTHNMSCPHAQNSLYPNLFPDCPVKHLRCCLHASRATMGKRFGKIFCQSVQEYHSTEKTQFAKRHVLTCKSKNHLARLSFHRRYFDLNCQHTHRLNVEKVSTVESI